MGETKRPPVDDNPFVKPLLGLFSRLKKYSEDYDQTIDDLFEQYDYLEDNEVMNLARNEMKSEVESIRNLFDELKALGNFTEPLLTNAALAYLPKKVNIPERDQPRYPQNQRSFVNVRERIDSLQYLYDEFLGGLEDVFADLDDGEIIDQDTFKGLSEDIEIALEKFFADFPALTSDSDKALVRQGLKVETPGRSIE
ncbi:MAG: hypothetical protein U0R17_03545 [Acidimicrobiia bacterium]